VLKLKNHDFQPKHKKKFLILVPRVLPYRLGEKNSAAIISCFGPFKKKAGARHANGIRNLFRICHLVECANIYPIHLKLTFHRISQIWMICAKNLTSWHLANIGIRNKVTWSIIPHSRRIEVCYCTVLCLRTWNRKLKIMEVSHL